MQSIFTAKPDPLELRLRTSGFGGQLKVWLPVVLAVTVIAIESTNTFSADHTSQWLRPRLEDLFGHLRDSFWWWFHHLLRKTGHFIGYGLVALTWLRAWLLTLGRLTDMPRNRWRWSSVLLAIAATALVASADEWHQTFLPSRTGQVSDMLLDTLGASVTCGLVWLFVWRRQKGRRRRSR